MLAALPLRGVKIIIIKRNNDDYIALFDLGDVALWLNVFTQNLEDYVSFFIVTL